MSKNHLMFYPSFYNDGGNIDPYQNMDTDFDMDQYSVDEEQIPYIQEATSQLPDDVQNDYYQFTASSAPSYLNIPAGYAGEDLALAYANPLEAMLLGSGEVRDSVVSSLVNESLKIINKNKLEHNGLLNEPALIKALSNLMNFYKKKYGVTDAEDSEVSEIIETMLKNMAYGSEKLSPGKGHGAKTKGLFNELDSYKRGNTKLSSKAKSLAELLELGL
jgi:hypothetical protein